MQKHAIALGYFFLTMFCIFTSSQGYLERFRFQLCFLALLAALAGFGYLISACSSQISAIWQRLENLFWLAQQQPTQSTVHPG